MNKEEIIEALKKIEKEVSDTDFWLAYCKSVVDLLDENKQLKVQLQEQKKINEEHQTLNGKLREAYNKLSSHFREEQDLRIKEQEKLSKIEYLIGSYDELDSFENKILEIIK